MKMNTKMMAVVIVSALAFVSLGILVNTGADDATEGETFDIDNFRYTIITNPIEAVADDPATDEDETVNPVNGTVSVEVIDKTAMTGEVILAETVENGGKSYDITKLADSMFKNTSITNLVIQSKVTETSQYFCDGVKSLTSLTLPEGVQKIGYASFRNTSLTEVNLPDGVTYIGVAAFQRTNIAALDLPESLETIEASAFSFLPLQEITIPGSPTLVAYVFGSCKSLTTATLGGTLGESLFSGCESLTTVNGISNFNTLPKEIFKGCSSLNLSIDDMTEIGQGACAGTALSQINFSNAVTIGESAFAGCKNLTSANLSKATIPSTAYLFDGCTNLTQVTLPSQMSTLDNAAFRGCTSLQALTLPDGVQSIASVAFNGCTNLNQLVLPDTIKSIGNAAFYGCKSLESLNLKNIESIEQHAFDKSSLKTLIFEKDVSCGEGSLTSSALNEFQGWYPAIDYKQTAFTVPAGSYAALYTPETYKVTVNVSANGEFWAKSGSVINFGTSGTPLEMYLEAGEQEITLSSMGYESKTVTVTVNEEGTATVNETLTADPTNIALDRTAQSIQQALDEGKKTIYIRTNSDKSEIVEVAEAGTEIIIERTVDGQDIVFSGNFTFGTSSIELYNVKFDAAGEFISIKSGSIELYGDIFDGVVVLSGDVKLVGDVNVGDGVTIVFKDGSTLDTNGYMFNFIGMPSVQTSSTTLTEAVLATYGFTNFISVDPIGEGPITTIFAVDGDKYLDITIENPIGTEATTEYTGYYTGKWTLVNAEQNAVYYGGSDGSLAAGATKMYLEVGDVPNGNYLLTISFMKNDGEAVAVSVDKPVSIYQGIILGMYYDGNDYHTIVKNLGGALTANTTIYAGAFYVKSIPGTQIDYVAYHPDALSATVSEDQINNVDFTLEVSATFVEDPIAFNPKYVTSDAVYYGAQTLSHYDAKDPLSHAVSYLKFNGEYALYAYAIEPNADTVYTLTAHYTDGGDIVTATYTYQMDESGYVEINLAEDFKNDSAEVVDLTADGITVIYFDIAGTEGTTEKVALEALTLNI